MRTENIKATITIPIPYDKPDKNGNIYTKEAVEKAEQERINKKRKKRIAYKERRKAKKELEEKERQIEIQKEAYLRAMKEMERGKKDE